MDIHGKFDEKFRSIVDCYEDQFELNLDIGSSLAITYQGEVVVDIWAGKRDKAQSLPWEENTIVNVFSSTKNATSLSAYVLADQGSWILRLLFQNIGPNLLRMEREYSCKSYYESLFGISWLG